jgi:hypothetical protein
MNSRCVGEDCLDVLEIDAESDRASTLARAFLAEMDQMFPVQFRQSQTPESTLEKSKARSLGAVDVLPNLPEIIAMKSNEIAECFCLMGTRRDCRLASIDAPFDF